MGQLRVERVQEFIQQEFSKLLLSDVKDPRIGFVTVTHVEVTGDLRSAKVFVSMMGSDAQKADTWAGLNHALGFMRSEIGRRLGIRHSPELTLHKDTSLEYSAKIQELLTSVNPPEKGEK